ncbi:MAG: hydrogenase maturation protease [Chloroflexaceae bacterium]|nr:hydrogenase maturation protease [Chloroflexaceae bacterium]
MSEPAPPILIIGYGNPLRSDDGVGYYAACLLEASEWSGAAVAVVVCQQLTPELSSTLSEAGRVIFIDARAVHSASDVGRIFYEPVQPDPAASPNLTHHVTPAALLTWTALLYGGQPLGRCSQLGRQPSAMAWSYRRLCVPHYPVSWRQCRRQCRLLVPLHRYANL